jgi:hypothetical protein
MKKKLGARSQDGRALPQARAGGAQPRPRSGSWSGCPPLVTAVICVVCHFLMGSARSFLTGKNAVRSGLELTLVGRVVAVITYGVGVALRTA